MEYERCFAEWTALFNGKLYAMIVAYADESGTHDSTGQQPGASVATIGGYIGLSTDWESFGTKWRAVLDQDAVPSFHFAEWNSARMSPKSGGDYVAKTGNYHRWQVRRLFRFMDDLGKVIVEHRVFPFGGWVDADKIHNAKTSGTVPDALDPYKSCLALCFSQISDIIFLRWPTQTANIIFDETESGVWQAKIVEQFHLEKSRNSRLSTLAFADDRAATGAGIQAADLIAGYIRQESIRQRDRIIKKQDSWEKNICKGKRFDLPINP